MAFPVVGASATYQSSGNVTDHPIPLPTGITSGQLLIAGLAANGNPTFTWPAGWTELFDSGGGQSSAGTMAYRIADGSEGTTVTVVTSATERGGGFSYRITGWHGTTPPEVATATGSSTTPDPPNLDPAGWAAEDTLWVAFYAVNVGSGTASTYPDNYLDNQLTGSGGGASGASCAFAVATRALNAAAENPGTFSISSMDPWVAATVAVRPAVAGLATSLVLRPAVLGRAHILRR